jgi:hypothetical protein
MDNLVSSACLSGMLAPLISILAILTIAVVTTVSAAHAARMVGMETDHAVHAGKLMHASADDPPSCDGGQHCGSADAGLCEFVCAGLSVVLSMPGAETGHAYSPASHDLPSEPGHASSSPGLNERPPRLGLL